MIIGKENKPWISLPKGNGIVKSNMEDRAERLAKRDN